MVNGLFILKGIIIGMIVCIPIGPLGFLSMQRTIKDGRMIGFLSGMGAALSDSIYCSLAVFGMSFIDDIIENYKCIITISTGIVFLILGVYIIKKSGKNSTSFKDIKDYSGRKNKIVNTIASTFIMGLSNPMTFLIFIAVFAKMRISLDATAYLKNLSFVVSILMGSCLLWIIVTNIINFSKADFGIKTIMIVDKVIGTLICACGVVSLVKAMLMLL